MLYELERTTVAESARRLLSSRLVVNTSGNVSQRVGDHIIITPSSCRYETIKAPDIVVTDLAGTVIEGELLPSSETPLHLALYDSDNTRRAIVHTHSVYATAVSTLVSELPAIHYQIVTLGGSVAVAPYRTFGTPELAQAVTASMQGRHAALMQNHGATTTGSTLDEAMERAITLEWLCKVYLKASQSGTPSLIEKKELERVRTKIEALYADQARALAARKDCDCDDT